jgi:hypothetical protein
MNKLLTLFRADFKQSFFWLKKHTLAKLVVIFASLSLIFGLITILFFGSFYYFWSIKFYEPYGQITSSYVVHSGLIITIWFVFLSSLAQTIQTLTKPSKELLFQMSQPISPLVNSIWLSFRTWILTTMLMLIFWLPVAVSFNAVYGSFSTTTLLGIVFAITAFITSFIQVIATFVSLVSAPLLQYGRGWVTFLSTTFLAGLTWQIITVIFPISLRELLRVEIDQFEQLFSSLPLNQPLVITGKVMSYLETGQINYLLQPLTFTICIIIAGVVANSLLISRSWQKIVSQHRTRQPFSPPIAWWYKNPHTLKEILSLVRNTNERNALFLFAGLFFFFFFFLQRSLQANPTLLENSIIIASFSLGAILFIATAFLLRIVFPLLSKEGHSGWYLLRESAQPSQIYYTKTGFAKYIIGIVIVLVNLGWILMPLAYELRQNLIVFSTIGFILIGWLNASLGMLVFEWEKGDNPDQVSTSGIGLLTLCLSLFVISGVIMSFSGIIAAYWHAPLLIIMIGIVIAVNQFAEKRSNRYQYPQSWE